MRDNSYSHKIDIQPTALTERYLTPWIEMLASKYCSSSKSNLSGMFFAYFYLLDLIYLLLRISLQDFLYVSLDYLA